MGSFGPSLVINTKPVQKFTKYGSTDFSAARLVSFCFPFRCSGFEIRRVWKTAEGSCSGVRTTYEGNLISATCALSLIFFWRSLKLETVVEGWNADPALLPRCHSDTAQRPHYCWHRISRPVHLTVELNLSLERDPETLKLLSNASLVVTARFCSRKWETELVTRVQCCPSPAPSEKMQMHISFCNAKKINTHLYVHLYRHKGTTRSTW